MVGKNTETGCLGDEHILQAANSIEASYWELSAESGIDQGDRN